MEIPTRLFNTALMVSPGAVEDIFRSKSAHDVTGVKTGKLSAIAESYMEEIDRTEIDKWGYALINGAAIIEVTGGLIYRGFGWGCLNYSDIRRMFRAAMADDRVERIAFLVDSPGGEVAGLFDLVDEIYRARGVKPIIAIADEEAFSAAYTIASAADQVYLPATGFVGSVGVIAIHVDQSGYDDMMGVKYTTVYAGDRKADFNRHDPLKPDARDSLQQHIDIAYGLLTGVVARNRGMTKEAVMDTQAGIYMGKDAVAVGLADGVLSVQEFIDKISKGEIGMNLNEVRDVVNDALIEGMKEVRQMLSAIEGRLIESEKKDADESPGDDQIKESVSTAAEIVDLCEASGVPEFAGVFIRDGLSVDVVKGAILEAKAKALSEQTILSTISPMTTGDVNPLLADAKKRAGSVQKSS